MAKNNSPNDDIYIVNACPASPGGGSPTGVVMNAGDYTEEQMLALSRCLDVSHTAFITAADSEHLMIRFFTGEQELTNCGHGTIAAVYLHEILTGTNRESLQLITLSGTQMVTLGRDGATPVIYLKQNEIAFAPVSQKETVQSVARMLGIPPTHIDALYPIVTASPGANRLLIAVKNEAILNSLVPDIQQMKELCHLYKCIGCFVYTVLETNDSLSATARMFAPMIGVNEDIINGNSSGCLGAYLLKLRYPGQENTTLKMIVYQGQNFGRNGAVLVRAAREDGITTTWIGGTATITGNDL